VQAVGCSQCLKVGTAFEMQIEIDEGFNVHRSQHRSIRDGEGVEDLRSHQAVACTKRCTQELGSPMRENFMRGSVRGRRVTGVPTGTAAKIHL